MSGGIHISLRAGEKIFVNGAVMRADRKVSIEFMNNVTFMLENHVLQPEDATTPLRQLYYIAQTKMIDPAQAELTEPILLQSYRDLENAFENPEIKEGLQKSREQMERGRMFDALKIIRGMYVLEEKILAKTTRDADAALEPQREIA